jgi:hypothetical protein
MKKAAKRMAANGVTRRVNICFIMQKIIFKLLAAINKAILPSYSRRDLTKLTKVDKAVIAYRYWITKNAL